jgi:hypothetical protein
MFRRDKQFEHSQRNDGKQAGQTKRKYPLKQHHEKRREIVRTFEQGENEE